MCWMSTESKNGRWILEIEHRPSERTASALNHRAISSPCVCLDWDRPRPVSQVGLELAMLQSGHNPFDLASWGLGYRNKLWRQLLSATFFLRFIHLCIPCVPGAWGGSELPRGCWKSNPRPFATTSVLNHGDNTLTLRVLLLTHSNGIKQVGACMLPYTVRGSYLPRGNL